ncbi:TBC/Rab GTPase activating domain containing protein [Entamoeba marina]
MKVENNTLFDIENYSNDVKTTNIKPPRTALKVTRAIENCNIQNSNNSTYTKIVSQTESIEVTLINNVYININEQWKIKGFINLYSRNGFVYFDYIPIKSIIVNDSLISKEEKKIFNINEYKCVFCFRDISSIQVMYSKTHQIISKTIYTIIFEPKNILPFTIPKFEFKELNNVNSLISTIKKKGIEIEKYENEVYKLDCKNLKEEFRKSINSIKDFSKKINSDRSKLTKRQGWLTQLEYSKIPICNKDLLSDKFSKELIQKSVKYKGCNENCRYIAWLICLGLIDNYKSKDGILQSKYVTYSMLKTQWKLFLPEQLEKCEDLYSINNQIEKDIHRTILSNIKWTKQPSIYLKNILKAYSIYDMEVRYMQGMNEICAKCLECVKTEEEGFVLFNEIMKFIRPFYLINSNPNKLMDKIKIIIEIVDTEVYKCLSSVGMNYLFAYRPILLLFLREFQNDKILRIWDVFYYFKSNDRAYLFVIVAIILHYREFILTQTPDFDAMMQFMINVKGFLDCDILWDTDIILNSFKIKANEDLKNIIFD